MKRWTGYCLYWKLHTHNILLLILETSTKASAQKNASLCVAGEASNKGQKQTAQNVGGQSAPNLIATLTKSQGVAPVDMEHILVFWIKVSYMYNRIVYIYTHLYICKFIYVQGTAKLLPTISMCYNLQPQTMSNPQRKRCNTKMQDTSNQTLKSSNRPSSCCTKFGNSKPMRVVELGDFVSRYRKGMMVKRRAKKAYKTWKGKRVGSETAWDCFNLSGKKSRMYHSARWSSPPNIHGNAFFIIFLISNHLLWGMVFHPKHIYPILPKKIIPPKKTDVPPACGPNPSAEACQQRIRHRTSDARPSRPMAPGHGSSKHQSAGSGCRI